MKFPFLFHGLIYSSLFCSCILFVISCDNQVKNENLTSVKSDSLLQVTKLSDSLNQIYDYTKNKQSYELTFLEFGSVGCAECKKMEKVLEQVRTEFHDKINVVFYNARIKENKKIFELYGIQLIPVQVLLDKNGKERFRHNGYYPFDSLKYEFYKISKF